ncbi:MAG: protein kinase [Pseudomonadota bacterium]
MFTNTNPKKRSHLTLNISQKHNELSKKEVILTPTNPLDRARIKQDFINPATSKEFIDYNGDTGIEYSNHYLLKLKYPITPGAHANIHQEQLISPGRNSSIKLVRKQGGNSIQSEIKIYQLIVSNPNSAEKSILQPLFYENTLYENTLHFPLMPGGNLKNQTDYLFNSFNDSNKKNITLIWLYKQIENLLEALDHLHTKKFYIKDHTYKGIVHGDIKLENILINNSGNLILADFDCAYPACQPAKQMGTIRYSAPEIFTNENFTKKPIKNIEKSDIWSLGIALQYLLTNEFPCFSNNLSGTKDTLSKFPFFKNEDFLVPRKRFKKTQTPFFKEGIEGFLYRKNWGETFSSSPLAKEAKKAMRRLNKNNYFSPPDLNQCHFSILYDLTLAMLLPIEERPSAAKLLKIVKKLAPRQPYSTEIHNEFVDELLKQSPLHQIPANKISTDVSDSLNNNKINLSSVALNSTFINHSIPTVHKNAAKPDTGVRRYEENTIYATTSLNRGH